MIITLQNNDVTYKTTSFDYINNVLWLIILHIRITEHYNNNIILQTMNIHNKTMIHKKYSPRIIENNTTRHKDNSVIINL